MRRKIPVYPLSDYSLLQHRFWFPSSCAPIIEVSKDQVRETASLVQEIQREFNKPAEGSDRIIRLLLQLILLKMNRFYIPQNKSQSSRREAQLVRDFLIAYELMFKDPSYFNRFFRRSTGDTPADFRKQCWLHATKKWRVAAPAI
jgi:hypothetical protein